MHDVMELVRQEMGPDAIIISTEENGGSARVTAALEAGATPPPPKAAPTPEQAPVALDRETSLSAPSREYDPADINAVLSHHGVPFDTASQLNTAVRASNTASLSEAFAYALETSIQISPLTDGATRPIMLVGPPGAGKTVCAAKLAADALLHERQLTIISTDTTKAAGVAQLDHFAQLMKQTVKTAGSATELKAILPENTGLDHLVVIDSPGTNPFDMDELTTLLEFIHTVDAEPVLVMPAGLDPMDAQEIADIFAKMGCQRFIATRLDAARRYASLIMAARKGYLSLAAVSRSPFVAEGLETASPMGVARLLTNLPRTKETPQSLATIEMETKQ